MVGIIGYGGHIPRFRLRIEDIWEVWADPIDTPAIIKKKRGLSEKAVARWDEDSVTMAIYAGKSGIAMAGIPAQQVDAIYFGSCTNPYASKAAVPIIAEALGAPPELMCADCQFATRSGTAALQIAIALVNAGMSKHALAIGSDALSRHVPPNDPLEYSASCGATSLLIGKEGALAAIEGMYSYNTQTPEFFRLDGERYIKHAANENEEYLVGYQRHVKAAVEGYRKRYGCKSADFSYVAFSQPDGRLPLEIGKEIGFTEDQIRPGLIAEDIGDCGSASPLLSLEAVLDVAKLDERILVVSYGFGAGCDVIGLRTTELLNWARERRNGYPSVKELIRDNEYVNYTQYLRQERKLIQEYV